MVLACDSFLLLVYILLLLGNSPMQLTQSLHHTFATAHGVFLSPGTGDQTKPKLSLLEL